MWTMLPVRMHTIKHRGAIHSRGLRNECISASHDGTSF